MKTHELFVVCFILFLILLLVGASANQKGPVGEVDAPLETEPPPQELPPPEEPPPIESPPENKTDPLPPVENETLSFFVASTELIDFTGMTTAQINTFLSLCYNQGMPELTVRLRAMYDWSSETPAAAEVAKVKTIITTANSLGITVNLDMHTWYTTWDNSFRDSVSGHAANRAKYINYVKAAINAFDGYPVKAWMALNEPQDRHATASENNFILDIITAANGETNQPISVRFMGSGSPTTGDYDTAIDTATDFLCRNMYYIIGSGYYDRRNYNAAAENAMIAVVTAADAMGKEAWITEFGKTKSNLEVQSSYVADSLAYWTGKGYERMFCWVSQPVGGSGENYNIFTGMTPNPAFYELVSSDEGGPETYTKQLTFGSHLQANYSKTFTFGAWLVTPPETEPVPKTFTFGAHLQAGYSKTFTFGARLQLSDGYPYPDDPAVSSTLFQDALAQTIKIPTPYHALVDGLRAEVDGVRLRVDVQTDHWNKLAERTKKLKV